MRMHYHALAALVPFHDALTLTDVVPAKAERIAPSPFTESEWRRLRTAVEAQETKAALDRRKVTQAFWRDLREKIENFAPFTIPKG